MDGFRSLGRRASSAQPLLIALPWFLEYGKWPEPMAPHKCDNPRCVRVEHLFEGDVVDNFADMRANGRERHLRGEQTGRAKLTENDVRRIRETAAVEPREKHEHMARRFGVSKHTLRGVLYGKTWRHVA